MKIASFDIGIRNLAFCILKTETNTKKSCLCSICNWGILPLCEPTEKVKQISLQLICQRMCTQLNKQEDFDGVDMVVLENQPVYMNPKMKSVQMMLFTYFVMNGYDVKMFSPRDKLSIYTGPEVECTLKSKYSRRKYLGIQYCSYILQNSTLSEFFALHKKKDDLADSLLQGLLYLKRITKTNRIEII